MPDVQALWPVVSFVLGAAAVYGGIRADLRSMKESIESAHHRLDEHINFHLKG